MQGSAKRWVLGWVNSPLAVRGSQEAVFTQPRAHLLAEYASIYKPGRHGFVSPPRRFIHHRSLKSVVGSCLVFVLPRTHHHICSVFTCQTQRSSQSLSPVAPPPLRRVLQHSAPRSSVHVNVRPSVTQPDRVMKAAGGGGGGQVLIII